MKYALVLASMFLATTVPAQAKQADLQIDREKGIASLRIPAADLATEQGVRSARARIQSAADRVCRASGGPGYTWTHITCTVPTANDGLAQLNRMVALSRAGELADGGTLIVLAR